MNQSDILVNVEKISLHAFLKCINLIENYKNVIVSPYSQLKV